MLRGPGITSALALPLATAAAPLATAFVYDRLSMGEVSRQERRRTTSAIFLGFGGAGALLLGSRMLGRGAANPLAMLTGAAAITGGVVGHKYLTLPKGDRPMGNMQVAAASAAGIQGGRAEHPRHADQPNTTEQAPAGASAKTSDPPEAPRHNPSMDEAERYIRWAANEFGISERVLLNIAYKESSGGVNTYNDWDANARAGHPTQGWFQFREDTFNEMSHVQADNAREANPQAFEELGEPTFLDWREQALVTAWALSHYDDAELHERWASYADSIDPANATMWKAAFRQEGGK